MYPMFPMDDEENIKADTPQESFKEGLEKKQEESEKDEESEEDLEEKQEESEKDHKFSSVPKKEYRCDDDNFFSFPRPKSSSYVPIASILNGKLI